MDWQDHSDDRIEAAHAPVMGVGLAGMEFVSHGVHTQYKTQGRDRHLGADRGRACRMRVGALADYRRGHLHQYRIRVFVEDPPGMEAAKGLPG